MSNTDNVTLALNVIRRRHRYITELREASPLLVKDLRYLTFNKPVEHLINVSHQKAEASLIWHTEQAYEILIDWCFAPVVKNHTKN